MTSGIYKLQFKDGSYYIGKSTNLTRRKAQHFRDLTLFRHINENVQFTYLACGLPDFIILETCSTDKLDTLEQAYLTKSVEDILEYKCLNISLMSKGANYGVHNHNCKTNKETIIKVFSMLLAKTPRKDIIRTTKVSEAMLADLATGRTHRWLKEVFGMQYTEYFSQPKKVFMTITNGIKSMDIINITQTAISLGVTKGNLYSLVRGDSKHCKGWYNINNPPAWKVTIYKDNKEIIITEYTNQTTIAKEINVDSSHLNNLIQGRKQSCHGWRIRK